LEKIVRKPQGGFFWTHTVLIEGARTQGGSCTHLVPFSDKYAQAGWRVRLTIQGYEHTF